MEKSGFGMRSDGGSSGCCYKCIRIRVAKRLKGNKYYIYKTYIHTQISTVMH